MLTLDRTLAQSIVDRAMTIIDGNVNVMDHTGVIIASGEPARIGQLHEGALLVLSRQGRVEIDAALAQQLDAVRPGVNLPLIADGRIVGCVGLTGDPQRIGQQAELVRMAAEAMLEQAGLLRLLARDARLREEVTLGLIRADGPTPALAGWAERLGIALDLPRVAAVIEVESDTLDLDAMLVELQRLHTLLSTPERGNLIAATALNELVVLKPALDRRGHWDVDEQRRRAHTLLERMRASSPLRIRLALGQYFPQPGGLALSHQIARTTMRIGKARAAGRCLLLRRPSPAGDGGRPAPGLAGRGTAQAAAGAAGPGPPRRPGADAVGVVRRRHAHGAHRQGTGHPPQYAGLPHAAHRGTLRRGPAQYRRLRAPVSGLADARRHCGKRDRAHPVTERVGCAQGIFCAMAHATLR